MSKAVVGAIEIGAAVGLTAATGGIGGFAGFAILQSSTLASSAALSLGLSGISMEAGAIADALTSNRGMSITTRQPAAYRQIIYGTQRVGGVIVYRSSTGGKHDQMNYVIVLATHEINAIQNLYLDGRKVYWQGSGVGNVTRGGYNFGGAADSNSHIGPDGQHYNFGGLVYCEARFGDQPEGDVIGGLTANDPTWAAGANGSPTLQGCAYVYLKVEYDSAMFPQEPEIKFTIDGKNDIYDPRTGEKGFTSNWALVVSDVFSSTWGVGATVNQEQLIAAANICDEQVPLAAGGTESRYTCHWHYDTSTAVGDVLNTMVETKCGRVSYIGGEWYIYPPVWTGASFSFDENALIGDISWNEKRSVSDLVNRVTGTYTAPNYPYNVAGNLYDTDGWYLGTIQNNFPFAFQPTSFPAYACDELHGYGTGVDVYLQQDLGIPHPQEFNQPCCLSISEAQRVAKIYMMRNRQQGTGSFPMSLSAWQMVPNDVMQFTMNSQSWANKYLEIADIRLRCVTVQDANGNSAQKIYVEVPVQETDPSVYDWSVAEELTVYDVPAAPGAVPYIVDPPTGLAIEDDTTTVSVQSDGTTVPRLLVTFTPPLDTYVNNGGKIEVQYQFSTITTAENGGTPPPEPSNMLNPVQQPDGSWLSSWVDAGSVSGNSTYMYVNGITPEQYQNINVQVRAVRISGAASAWAEVSHTLADTLPQQVTNVSATESPYKTSTGMQSLVAVDFTPVSGDKNYSSVNVYFTGYNGNQNAQLMASAFTSPAEFLCGTTHETVIVTVVAVNQNGVEASFANAPICAVSLDGVVSAPPAPSIAAAQTALDGNTGWQFAFNIIGGLEFDQIQGYRVYHSESNVAPVPPSAYYRTIPQPSTNIGQEVVQEVTGDILFYWVSAVSTSGLESALVPVPFTYIDPGSPPPNVSSVSTTTAYYPTTLLNGWGNNAHVGNYEGGGNLGSEVWGLNNAPTLAYSNPQNAFDGNQSTGASCSESHTHQYAGCIWSFAGFSLPAGVTPTAAALHIISDVRPTSGPVHGHADIWYSLDNGTTWTKLYVSYSTRAIQTDTITLSTSQDFSQIQIMAFLDSHDDIAHDVYDIALSLTGTSYPGPQQVSGVTAALVGGDVQISWSGLAPLSRTDIIGYQVYRALHGAGYTSSHLQTTVTPAPPQATYSWTDPEAHDGSWDYWVIAHNSTGYSPASQVVSLQSSNSVLYLSGDTLESLKPAQAGADVTANQPLAWSGTSNSIVPNGNFLLGTAEGWSLIEGTGSWNFTTLPNAANGIQIAGGQQAGVGSLPFQVTPGQTYRFVYTVWAGAGTQDTYLRVNYSDTFKAQITQANRSGYTDFISAGTVSTTAGSSYTYDWTCPAGVNFASVAVYNWIGSSATLYVQRIVVYPYTGVSEWGADQTAGKSLDILVDGSTYGRPLISRLNAGRPLIDFSEMIHVNKTLDYVGNGSGRYAAGEAGADQTSNHSGAAAESFPPNVVVIASQQTITLATATVNVASPTDVFLVWLTAYSLGALCTMTVQVDGSGSYATVWQSNGQTSFGLISGLSAGSHNITAVANNNTSDSDTFETQSCGMMILQIAASSGGFNTAPSGGLKIAKPLIQY